MAKEQRLCIEENCNRPFDFNPKNKGIPGQLCRRCRKQYEKQRRKDKKRYQDG